MFFFVHKSAAFMGLLAMSGTAIAETSRPCITPVEARNVMPVALPEMLNGAIDKCRPSLGATAFLNKSGPDLVARHRVTAKAAYPAAKALLLKQAGPQASILTSLPDEASMKLLSLFLGSETGKAILPKNCVTIDRAVSSISPLPLANMSDLIVLWMENGGTTTAKLPFTLCAPPAPVLPKSVTTAKSAPIKTVPTKTEPATK